MDYYITMLECSLDVWLSEILQWRNFSVRTPPQALYWVHIWHKINMHYFSEMRISQLLCTACLADMREFCLCKTTWSAFTFRMEYWNRLNVLEKIESFANLSKPQPDSWWVCQKQNLYGWMVTPRVASLVLRLLLCKSGKEKMKTSILQYTKSLCSTVFFWERDVQGLIQWVRHSQSQAQRKRPRFSRMISS